VPEEAHLAWRTAADPKWRCKIHDGGRRCGPDGKPWPRPPPGSPGTCAPCVLVLSVSEFYYILPGAGDHRGAFDRGSSPNVLYCRAQRRRALAGLAMLWPAGGPWRQSFVQRPATSKGISRNAGVDLFSLRSCSSRLCCWSRQAITGLRRRLIRIGASVQGNTTS